MPKVIRDLKMNVLQDSLYSVITDFKNYPKFLSEVVDARVESEEPLQVQFSIEVIKKFQYTLEFECQRPNLVKWKMLSSNFFKKNEGLWELTQTPSGLEVHYELNVDMGFFVPSMVTQKITDLNLPIMFKSFEEEAKKRGGTRG